MLLFGRPAKALALDLIGQVVVAIGIAAGVGGHFVLQLERIAVVALQVDRTFLAHRVVVALEPALGRGAAQFKQLFQRGALRRYLAGRRHVGQRAAAVDAVHVDGFQALARHAVRHQLVQQRDAAHLRDQAGVEGQIVRAVGDFGRRGRTAGALERVDLHQQHVAGFAHLQQRADGGVGRVAAVPIGLAVDLGRLKQLRQAGRGHHGRRREPLATEDLGAAGFDVGGGDEHARRLQLLQPLEIDFALDQLAQRVDVERVGLVGRKTRQRTRQRAHHQLGQARRAFAGGAQFHDLVPHAGQAGARAFVRVLLVRHGLRPAVRQRHGIDGAGAGAADAGEVEAPVLQQRVQHAPGEGAVRAAALQGQVNGFGGGITHAFSEPQADEKF